MTRRGIHLGYWGAIPVWLAAMFMRPLHVDGAEHAHVAWLQATLGLEPMRDFFQHHTPMLWDLLRVYYLLGGEGIGVVYYGRALVVLAGILTVAGFWQLGRQLRRGPRTYPPGMLAVVFFIFTTVTLDALFVIRAETMGIPLVVWSLVLWARPVQQRLGWDLISGMLVGLAAFASPRFVLLGGMFLVLSPDPARLLVTDLRRYVVLTIGALLAVAAYLFAKGMSVADFRFILEFSSLLQHYGDGGASFSRNYLLVLGVAGFVFWRLYQTAGPAHGRAWLLDLGLLLVVIVANLVVAGSYPYHHAFAPTVLLIALLLIRAEERVDNQGPLRDLYYGVVLVSWVYTISMREHSLARGQNLLRDIQAMRTVLVTVPPGEAILAFPSRHPIAMADGSYYARPLTSGPGRLCKVVAASPSEWGLPPCDYLADLKARKPLLVTRRLELLVEPATEEKIKAYVDEYYVKTPCYYVRAGKNRGGSVAAALEDYRYCSPYSR